MVGCLGLIQHRSVACHMSQLLKCIMLVVRWIYRNRAEEGVAGGSCSCVYRNNPGVIRSCPVGHATDSRRDCFSFLGYVVHDLGGLCRHVTVRHFQKTKTLTHCLHNNVMIVTLTSSGKWHQLKTDGAAAFARICNRGRHRLTVLKGR